MAENNHSGHNPLVETTPEDTLDNVRAVLAFLQWTKTTEPDVELGGEALAGEYQILGCCTDAIEILRSRLGAKA